MRGGGRKGKGEKAPKLACMPRRAWAGPVDRHVSEWASFKNFLGRGKIGEENLLEHCGFIILDRLCRQEVIGFLRLQEGSDPTVSVCRAFR